VIEGLKTGFGLTIGFIVHVQFVTTSNYSAIANSHTLQFTTAHNKSSQSAVSSLVLHSSIELLLASANTDFPGFNLLEIHDQDFYSPLDMYVFRNGASSSTKEGSVFLYRRYVCCTVVSVRVYPRCRGVQVAMDFVHPSSLLYNK
jgi:hypothetical protein